jgi:hypothetical protein
VGCAVGCWLGRCVGRWVGLGDGTVLQVTVSSNLPSSDAVAPSTTNLQNIT